jgi:hypothetical protein
MALQRLQNFDLPFDLALLDRLQHLDYYILIINPGNTGVHL